MLCPECSASFPRDPEDPRCPMCGEWLGEGADPEDEGRPRESA